MEVLVEHPAQLIVHLGGWGKHGRFWRSFQAPGFWAAIDAKLGVH